MNSLIHACLDLVKPQFRLDLHHGQHGIGHWARVWVNGRELCHEMGLCDLYCDVVCAFAFLHDSQRFGEGNDPEHGQRAVNWLNRLYLNGELGKLNLGYRQYKLLCRAIITHHEGEIEAPHLIQICWDAERLDIGRLGIRPNPWHLCTSAAKDPDRIQRCYERSIRNEYPRYEQDMVIEPKNSWNDDDWVEVE